MSNERIKSVLGNKASRPVTDFVLSHELNLGPPAKTYYVDGNVSATGGGTVGHPYKTLAEAITASNASMALASNRFWARRNRIFACGDDLTENLVALPEKCDIIGCGSSDLYSKACLRGNHVPVNNKMGCRFFNFRFRPAASGDLWTLASTTGGGFEIWDSFFEAQYSTFTAPSAIDSTACPNVRIMNSEFSGAFSSNYIDIGAGLATGWEIAYNRMQGSADNGIMTTGTVTVSASHMGKIHNNFVQCADIIIDTQTTSVFNVYDNVGISGEALGANSYVIDLTFAARNLLTGNDISVYVPSCTTVA